MTESVEPGEHLIVYYGEAGPIGRRGERGFGWCGIFFAEKVIGCIAYEVCEGALKERIAGLSVRESLEKITDERNLPK